MRIAFIGDPHLLDLTHTPQEAALDWSLEELRRIRPDACAFLGDITACGSPDAAIRFVEKVRELPFPCLTVPGNSDVRTPNTAPLVRRFLANYPQGLRVGDVCLVGIDTADNSIVEGERKRLEGVTNEIPLILCSHQAAKHLDEDSLRFLSEWMAARRRLGQKILLWASGHVHVFRTGEFEGVPTLSVRAVDPDKCMGGGAQICVVDTDEGLSSLCETVYDRNMPAAWSDAERQELCDSLGISCYTRTKIERDMPFAIANGVKHLEWRSILPEELPWLERWRKSGGRSFSLHLPAMGYKEGMIKHQAKIRDAVASAVMAEADMVTVHPPQVRTELMQGGSHVFDNLADAMAEALLPLTEAGIDILVENNHTEPGVKRDPMLLPYGCTPMDLFGWRNALRERLGEHTCHLRLDVGHARNNVPLCREYPLGKWYATVGRYAYAYHLHQTVLSREDKIMHNHHPILGWHEGGLIAFDGFLWAWRTGLLRHSPVILEIREGEGAPATWERLQKLIREP